MAVDAPDMGRVARRVLRRWVLLAIMSTPAIRDALASGHRYHLAFIDGVLVGVAAMRDNSHLYQFYVSTRYQRRGIARRLWSRVMADAVRRAGTERFTLNASDAAIPAYLALGFARRGARQAHANGVISTPMHYLRVEAAQPRLP